MVVTEAKPDDVKAAQAKLADFWDSWAKAQGPEHVEALGKVKAALGK